MNRDDLTINDKNLLRAIEDTIGSVVTKEKLETIKRISWDEYMAESDPNSWSPVRDISGIEHCVNLEELYFDGNEVCDLWPLANLTKLREIRMVQNQITDLEPLRFLNNLKSLVLDMNTAVEDISPIANLPVLEYLNISRTQVKDITPLQSLAKIKKVSLYNIKALPLDDQSPNRKALIELIIKGVEIHIEDSEKYVREAEQEKENRKQIEALPLIDFLKAHNGFRLAQLVEEKGINGILFHGDGREHDHVSVLHMALEPDDTTEYDPLKNQKLVVERLIKEGAPINHQDDWGDSPLMYFSGHFCPIDIEVVKLLVQNGANMNLRNSVGESALAKAADCGLAEVVTYFTHRNVDIDLTDFNYLCKGGFVKEVKSILEKGFKINQAETNPLEAVVLQDRIEVATLLLDHGCDINFKTTSGSSVLFSVKSSEMVALLVKAGIDMHAQSKYGENALFEAAQSGRVNVVKALFDCGAQLVSNHEGRSSIQKIPYFSYHKKQFEDVVVLIENGLAINQLDKAGKTALDYMEDNDGKNILKKYGARSATELTA